MPEDSSDRRGRAADRLGVLLAGLGPLAYLTFALLLSPDPYAMLGVLTAAFCFVPIGGLILLTCLRASSDRVVRRIALLLLIANFAAVFFAFLRPAP